MAPPHVHIIGSITDNAFHQVVAALNFLQEAGKLKYDSQSYPEAMFEKSITEKCQEIGDAAAKHMRLTGRSCLVWQGNLDYIGGADDCLTWAKKNFDYTDKTPRALYRKRTAAAVAKYMQDHKGKRQFAYLDVSVGFEETKRIVIELYTDVAPRTCDNFLGLCEPVGDKFGYKGTCFHRVVKNGWIQGGDVRNNDGDGGFSIYGQFFEDENFALKHTWAGDVCVANCGPHSNGSQFYITAAPMPWLDNKQVVFGRVFSGMNLVRRIERLDAAPWNNRPVLQVVIASCGEIVE